MSIKRKRNPGFLSQRALAGLAAELHRLRPASENTCLSCQCRGCISMDCPSKCKSHLPCDAPVTKCKDRRAA